MVVRRWRYLITTAATGAALALLGYAFAVRGLGLNRGLKSGYMLAAAVLAVGSRRLLRGETDGRPSLLILLGSGTVGAAIATALSIVVDPPLLLRSDVTHALPGFTVAIPKGHKDQLAGGDYTTGTLTVELDRDVVVAVGWVPGDGSRRSLEALERGVELSLPTPKRSSHIEPVDGHDTFVLELERGDTLYLTTVPCDGRTIFVQSIDIGLDLHARIVRSIACKPAAHATPTVPIEIDSSGMPRTVQQDGTILFSDGKAMISAGIVPPVAALTSPAMASEMLKTQGFTNVDVHRETPDSVSYTASLLGIAGTGVIRLIRCESRAALVVSFAREAARAAQLQDAVMAARCQR